MKKITLILSILLGYLLSTVPCHAYRDLETGVFLTRDPAGFVDGPNAYTYVRQNPWTKFDPEGLQGIPTWETREAISVNTAYMLGGEREARKMHDAYATGRKIATPIVAAATVGTVATVVTGGAVGPALTAMGVSGTALSITTAVFSGAAGGYAGNATSNVVTGRPVNEGGVKAAIYGAAAGAVLQTGANLGRAFMEGWTGGAASARSTLETMTTAAKGVDQGLGPYAPGDVPDAWMVVKGGGKPPPTPGEVFSTSYGTTLNEAGAGVPHGQIQPTTAGQIRAGGGSVDVAPEMTGDVMNFQHANVVEGSPPTKFQPPIPNPVPKPNRIGGSNYGR